MKNEMNNKTHDRLLLFLSTDFFLKYWQAVSGKSFSHVDQIIIQTAARHAVEAFVEGASVLWDIDFSAARERHSWVQFEKALSSVTAEGRQNLNELESQFCADKEELKSTTFLLGFLHRIATDSAFTQEVGLSIDDHNLVGACMAEVSSQVLDTFEIEEEWLRSSTLWDTKIRDMTPDVPRLVFLDFAEIYEQHSELPVFIENLSQLLSHFEKQEFLKRLAKAILNNIPEDSDISVPKALLEHSGC